MSSVRRAKRSSTRPAHRLLWTHRAEADLEEIGDYIAADDPRAAERWVGKLIEQARKAASSPLAGRVVPEIGIDAVREVFLRTYRLIYRVRPEAVVVLTVIEGHRRLPRDLDTDDLPEPPSVE